MDTLYDIIIVGSGPAGMTSAIYAARNNLKVMIVESSAPGGQMINTNSIENYPGYKKIDGATLAYSMYEQVMNYNITYVFGTCEKIIRNTETNEERFTVQVDDHSYNSKNVVVATGTKNRKLNVDGEKRFIGRGISFCAICDGNLYKNKTVCVIGGGNASLEESLYLSKIAKEVILIHRREEFRADESVVEEVKNTGNIRLVLQSKVIRFNGNNTLESIDVENISTKKIDNILIDGCFEYVGMIPSSELLSNFDCLDESGYVIVDENFQTNVKGLYAIGDVTNKKIRQIITACNDGAIASMHISKVNK